MGDHDGGPDEELEERKERQHFAAILRAFDHYPRWALARVSRLEEDYKRLGARQCALLGLDAKVCSKEPKWQPKWQPKRQPKRQPKWQTKWQWNIHLGHRKHV